MNYRIRDDVPEDEDASRLLWQDVEMDTMMGSARSRGVRIATSSLSRWLATR